MPLPPNDPRRRNPPAQPPPPAGTKPGTGFVPGRFLTFRQGKINATAFPAKLKGVHFDDPAASTGATIQEMEKWIPEYAQGHRWKNVDQMLIGLWQARAIPGLTPEEHAQYDGRPTVEEWYLLAFTEDSRVLNAWKKLGNGGAPPPQSGNKPGTGFVPSRFLTFRQGKINVSACPPKLEAMHFDDSHAGTAATLQEMEEWIPEYQQGHRWKTPDQILAGLWQARAIPGLSPEEHAQFDGKPTLKEWYLLAFTEDARAFNAWKKISGATGTEG